jgi:hypothetical protein
MMPNDYSPLSFTLRQFLDESHIVPERIRLFNRVIRSEPVGQSTLDA